MGMETGLDRFYIWVVKVATLIVEVVYMNIDIESLKKHVPEELSVSPIIYTYYRAKAKVEKFKEACREEYRESHMENTKDEEES